jgi:putative DNA primase/helicase
MINSNNKKIVATYRYEDENEQLLCEAVRYEPKSFRYRQPDGKGGWIWNLEGVRRVPYRLPELLASKETVFIPGGEKDVDRLWEAGLIATTNLCGEGNWLDEFSLYLVGRDVVILEDNDKKGLVHGKSIAQSLWGIACSIKIVRFTELPKHGDVSDYLEDHSVDELLKKVEDAALYEQPENNPSTISLEESNTASDKAPDSMAQIMEESGISRLTKESTVDQKHEAIMDFVHLTQGQNSTWLKLAQNEVADQLNKIGVKGSSQLVTNAFKSEGSSQDDSPSHTLDFEDPEPWEGEVDGLALLSEITGVLEKYVILPDGGRDAVALWILFSWTHNAFEVSPLLNINSPVKRCGKTTLLEVLSALAPSSLAASNISTAALFRSIEAFMPTLLIDEADTFLNDNQEINGVLNAGHRRRGAFVIRVEGDDHAPRTFSVWCPKVFAGIGKRKDTLEDRSIVISMRRKETSEKVERIRLDRLGELEGIKRRAFRWANDSIEALKLFDPELPDSLNDRSQDNWRPLVAIAECVGGPWPEQARQAAIIISGEKNQPDESNQVMLLSDIKDIFDEVGEDRVATEELLKLLNEMEDRPWPEYKKGFVITASIVARILKPFNVRPNTIRFLDGSTKKGYHRSDFDDAFKRYLSAREDEDVTDVTIPF